MKISRNWLSDFIDWRETDPAVIADEMTRCMGEVEAITEQGKYMDRCVVGRIQTLEKHPNADKLSLCTIQTDEGTKRVVCGGTNLREEMLVAFAHVGATVRAGGKDPLTLSKVKIRGIESEGMICAAEELEITSLFPVVAEHGNRPIADLSDRGYKVGESLRVALGFDDVIFHIDNHAITNRADLFSHVGVARELVAMGLATWKKTPKKASIGYTKQDALFTIVNEVTDLVPQYVGCFLTVEGQGATPDWMKRRLEATGWRTINLVVDITNYVLMEVGMPLHAFDADDIRGTIKIRRAKRGEVITTLDGATRNLPEGSVVMSDTDGIFDLFGVMGGLRTSQKPTTKHIFVQAGVIDAASVRRTILAMAHRTDAATVYEKGVTLSTAEAGLARAVELLRTIHPSAYVSSRKIGWGKERAAKPIAMPVDMITSVIGVPIGAAETKGILTDLGCTMKKEGKKILVTPPVWRRDIAIAQDVVEEVARIYRYAKIPPVMPDASIVPPDRDHRIHMVRDALRERGYIEMLHLAFVGPEMLKKCSLDVKEAISIENPLGEELSLMRTSLLPALLTTLGRELRTFPMSHLRAYEFGRTFVKGKGESQKLAMLIAAKDETTIADDPFLLLKRDLTSALAAMGYTVVLVAAESPSPSAHPGRFAKILCGQTVFGCIFEVHPVVRSAFDLPHRVAALSIDLDVLRQLSPIVRTHECLPTFPSVVFDETVLLGSTPFGTLQSTLKRIDPLLRNISVLHFYEGESTKNVTLRFTYRSDERTLTQTEAEVAHAKVREALTKAT